MKAIDKRHTERKKIFSISKNLHTKLFCSFNFKNLTTRQKIIQIHLCLSNKTKL